MVYPISLNHYQFCSVVQHEKRSSTSYHLINKWFLCIAKKQQTNKQKWMDWIWNHCLHAIHATWFPVRTRASPFIHSNWVSSYTQSPAGPIKERVIASAGGRIKQKTFWTSTETIFNFVFPAQSQRALLTISL